VNTATSAYAAEPPRPSSAACDAAMLDALLAKSPVASAFIDTDLRVRRVSRLLAEMLGRPADEQVGHTPAEIWSPSLAASAESAVRKVIADGLPVSDGLPGAVVAGLDAGSGDGRQIALTWHPGLAQDGTVTGVTMIAEDLNGDGISAEAVRRTRERYRSLVQAGNQVVWVTNPTGEVAEDSPEWRWITGQSLEDYLADGWLAAIHPNDRDRIERDWRDCISTGTVFDASYRVRTKTGSYRYYDVRAVPIERDGAIIEWMGASTDVTGQREADEMRGRLTEQLSAAALRTSRLQQATSLLAEALSVKEVLTVITEVGRSAIAADRAAVGLVVGNDRLRMRVVGAAGPDGGPGEMDTELPLEAPSVMAAAISLRRSLVFSSPESLRRHFDADEDDVLLRHDDERAWVGLPLTTSGAPLGALQFSFTAPHQITDEERVFLEALAGQGALALERATMYEREHATAETLQHSLLPDTLPEVPGIALRATYRPVSREVGGDWYDAFRLPDGKLAVAAGDVMGKGLTAAAGMGRVRNALRALALTDPRPAAVLAGLDRLFLATELDEQVTTVCYLVVDPETGDGVAGNAGHLPPLMLGPAARPRLDQNEAGTPLGWASPRQQYPFSLPPGNTAVLYSDGLVENRRRGLDTGLDELVAVAAQAPAAVVADPDKLIAYLVEAMMTGYEQDDDVTVLVLQMPMHHTEARVSRPSAASGKGRGRARG
jgi:PAS domain S-box-containing protein